MPKRFNCVGKAVRFVFVYQGEKYEPIGLIETCVDVEQSVPRKM